jgi:hypothetical protein
MALKYDISTMSHSGYTIKKEKIMYQSHNFNFGFPKEIEFETMWCEKCDLECPTRRKINEENTMAIAFEGWCLKCAMNYFVKNVWG